jgi:hypothetical protein
MSVEVIVTEFRKSLGEKGRREGTKGTEKIHTKERS